MKKQLLTLLILCTLTNLACFSQVKLGVKGGLNMTSINYTDDDYNSNKTVTYIGNVVGCDGEEVDFVRHAARRLYRRDIRVDEYRLYSLLLQRLDCLSSKYKAKVFDLSVKQIDSKSVCCK